MILPSRKPLPIPRPSSYASLREWFAEAREASVHDDAEVKTWKVARQSGRKRGLFES